MKYIIQKWEESERGWGTRPDGFSIHKTDADRIQYIRNYSKSLPDEAPDEYSRLDGTPYEVELTDEQLKELVGEGNYSFGWRVFSRKYPGDGGPDGWKPVK